MEATGLVPSAKPTEEKVLYPDFDPVAIHIGPLAVRWYALAYITGLLAGWALIRRYARPYAEITSDRIDDFLTWATLGVVLGGRLGYVLFYRPGFYLTHPLEIVKVWEGGMSFHGGCLGVIIATFLFSRKKGVWVLGDLIASVAPIGLFFGRIANFINGELYGRIVSAEAVPWAMVFPRGGPLPRHPSQLYEAALEGILLFLVLAVVRQMPLVRRHPGTVAGVFLVGYGVARFVAESFREPDAFLGYVWEGATMGQLLSLPMVAVGVGVVVWAMRRPAREMSDG